MWSSRYALAWTPPSPMASRPRIPNKPGGRTDRQGDIATIRCLSSSRPRLAPKYYHLRRLLFPRRHGAHICRTPPSHRQAAETSLCRHREPGATRTESAHAGARPFGRAFHDSKNSMRRGGFAGIWWLTTSSGMPDASRDPQPRDIPSRLDTCRPCSGFAPTPSVSYLPHFE
jgi:hypothetical protein